MSAYDAALQRRLSPQALMRARCPRSLVKNRRREAASPYHSELGAGRSKEGLGQDVPATMKRCPARCRTQPAGRWRSPFEEIASSYYSLKIQNLKLKNSSPSSPHSRSFASIRGSNSSLSSTSMFDVHFLFPILLFRLLQKRIGSRTELVG